MTEEDQLLVAKAALAGARFRTTPGGFWRWVNTEGTRSNGWASVGRAAASFLYEHQLMPPDDYNEYHVRTGAIQKHLLDSTPPFSALAGCQLEVAKAEEPTP